MYHIHSHLELCIVATGVHASSDIQEQLGIIPTTSLPASCLSRRTPNAERYLLYIVATGIHASRDIPRARTGTSCT